MRQRPHPRDYGSLLIWVFVCATLHVSLAQGAPPATPNAGPMPSMPLDEALAYAQRHQPSLLAAQARVSVAEQTHKAVLAEWLPLFGATAQLFYGTMNNSTAMFQGVRTVDVPRIGGSRSDGSWPDAHPSTLVAAGVRQLVFDFGRLSSLAAAAAAETRAQRHQASFAAMELALQVELQFYAVRAAHAVQHIAEEALNRATQRKNLTQAFVERGLRAQVDLTRVEADVARFEVLRLRAQAGLELSQTLFAAIVGVPEPLLDAAEQDETKNVQTLVGPTPDQALDHALENEPALRAALAKWDAQRATTRATQRAWAPVLSFTGAVSGRAGGAPQNSGPSDFSGLLPAVPNWHAGLVLQAPIFDATLLSRIAASRAQEQVLEHEVQAVRRRMVADVQRAYATARLAEGSLPALLKAAQAAQKNAQQAQARFQNGLGPAVELADAEALQHVAELDLAVGRFEVSRSLALFRRAVAQVGTGADAAQTTQRR